MNAWTISPSLHTRHRAALGAPDGRELRRGQTVEVLLGGFRILGFLECGTNGVAYRLLRVEKKGGLNSTLFPQMFVWQKRTGQ